MQPCGHQPVRLDLPDGRAVAAPDLLTADIRDFFRPFA
jgi:hypothetical protein